MGHNKYNVLKLLLFYHRFEVQVNILRTQIILVNSKCPVVVKLIINGGLYL